MRLEVDAAGRRSFWFYLGVMGRHRFRDAKGPEILPDSLRLAPHDSWPTRGGLTAAALVGTVVSTVIGGGRVITVCVAAILGAAADHPEAK